MMQMQKERERRTKSGFQRDAEKEAEKGDFQFPVPKGRKLHRRRERDEGIEIILRHQLAKRERWRLFLAVRSKSRHRSSLNLLYPGVHVMPQTSIAFFVSSNLFISFFFFCT